jgi:OOP family OmpA-OmpF porin
MPTALPSHGGAHFSTTTHTTMKKLLTILVLCGAGLSSAWAQSSRYYGAVDYGTVNYSGPGSYSSPGALTLSGGYNFLTNLDLEAGVTLVGNASADLPGPGRVDVSEHIVHAVAIGKVPLNQQITLFGKAGVGLHDGEINGLPDDLIYGFGMQVRFDREFSMRVQYESLGRAQLPGGDTADMTRLSVGLAYHF